MGWQTGMKTKHRVATKFLWTNILGIYIYIYIYIYMCVFCVFSLSLQKADQGQLFNNISFQFFFARQLKISSFLIWGVTK